MEHLELLIDLVSRNRVELYNWKTETYWNSRTAEQEQI